MAGEAHIVGNTTSTDFPTTPGVYDRDMDDGGDAFVVRLNADGTTLIFSTLIGGADYDYGWDLALDEAGHIYMAGTTFSGNFPITPEGFDYHQSLGEAYALKLSPDGRQVIYATYLGGQNGDYGYGIAVDETGSAYVAGWTVSPDFPLTAGAFDTTYSNLEGFVAKLNPAGSALIYSTFLGGDSTDVINGLTINKAGQAFVTGYTNSPNFPVTAGAVDPNCVNCGDGYFQSEAFIVKLAADGSAVLYASFLGGDKGDSGEDIQVSAAGSIYVTGYTYSPDFPTTPDGFDTNYCENCTQPFPLPDVFLTRITPNGQELAYSTFLGGDQDGDRPGSLAVDQQGHAYLAGSTSSADFPVTATAYDTTFGGLGDVFVAKLATGSDEPEPEPPLPAHTCGPTLLGEIQVGATPRGVAVDEVRDRVYVANFGSNSLSVIDGNNNQLLQTVPGVSSANGVAYDETSNLIWVTNYANNSVTPIQPDDEANNFTVLPPITVGQGPWGVAYDPIHNFVYVANSVGNSLSVIDASSRTVVATLTNGFNRPFHLAANPITGKVYVANTGHNSVTIVQGTAVSQVAQLWDSGRPYGIAVDETRDIIYVATVESHRIVALGPIKGKPDQFLGWASFQRGYNRNRPLPLRAIAINPQLGPAPDGGHLWSTTAAGDGSELNQGLLIPKGWGGYFHVPFPQEVGDNPTDGIAVNRVTQRVYISSGTNPGRLAVIGDHDAVCGGVAPAAIPADEDQFVIERFSMVQLLRSDLNGDGQVDILDLASVAGSYGQAEASADLNDDGMVDIMDLVIIANYYGQKLPEDDFEQ
jgi:YVTN family beta-propeller protein